MFGRLKAVSLSKATVARKFQKGDFLLFIFISYSSSALQQCFQLLLLCVPMHVFFIQKSISAINKATC